MNEIQKKFAKLIPLQEKQCEIVGYLDQFCQENGIRWCLAYGSALGARREKGPIPWDDDMDLYMPVADYEKFRRLFREKGDQERFYLQELGLRDGRVYAAKLRMNGTAFLESVYGNKDMHQGIFVDIFLLHEAPDTKWKKAEGIAASCYMQLKKLSNRDYHKRKIVQPILRLLRLFPGQFGFKTAYRMMYRGDQDGQSQELADWELYTGSPRWFIPKDVIFPIERTEYSGHQFCVPHEIERYLEICYGDWMTVPDIDQIRWDQHASRWSTTEDFRTMLPNIHDFSDERF